LSLDDLPLHMVLDELAEIYETVAALPPVVQRIAGASTRSKPGAKLPPGLAERLDIDEYERAVRELDEWALYVAHHLLDVEPGIGTVPDETPGRLRLAARWADRLGGDPDLFARYAFESDARGHLVTMRRLARRGTRRVHTRSACLDVTCEGEYAAVIDGPEVDGDLVCSRCGDRVPRATWEKWGSRSEWVTVEHVQNMLGGVSVNAVYSKAKREGWRRRGEGRQVRYHVDDVTGRMTA
jgi:hypothetical protein